MLTMDRLCSWNNCSTMCYVSALDALSGSNNKLIVKRWHFYATSIDIFFQYKSSQNTRHNSWQPQHFWSSQTWKYQSWYCSDGLVERFEPKEGLKEWIDHEIGMWIWDWEKSLGESNKLWSETVENNGKELVKSTFSIDTLIYF